MTLEFLQSICSTLGLDVGGVGNDDGEVDINVDVCVRILDQVTRPVRWGGMVMRAWVDAHH